MLAAGESRRLGRPKQSVRLNGKPLLRHAIEHARRAVDGEVHVVLGASASTFHELATDAATCVHCFDDWAQGQAATLRYGLAQTDPSCALLVMLCDQYRLDAGALTRLTAAWRAHTMRPAAADYDGVLGVPVIWPADWKPRLVRVSRAQGLLSRDTCTAVPMPAAAYDLDTPADLQALRQFEQSG